MTRWTQSLQTKLTASFIVLILVISGLTFVYTYGESKTALKESIRDELIAVSGVIATQVDPVTLLPLKPGDEGTPAHLAVVNHLMQMRSLNRDITNVYILKVAPDGTMEFLVDDAYGDSPEYALIGEAYDSPDRAEIMTALSTPSASREFYSDKWGTFLSGYAPVRDASGATMAVLGVDMTADRVIAKQNYIGIIIFGIIGISILIAAGIIALFSRTIIRDIRKLNDAAGRISMGDATVIVDVRRNDEIGELADSFSRMVSSLKIMMNLERENP